MTYAVILLRNPHPPALGDRLIRLQPPRPRVYKGGRGFLDDGGFFVRRVQWVFVYVPVNLSRGRNAPIRF